MSEGEKIWAKRLRDPRRTPKGGWEVIVPQTGAKIRGQSLGGLASLVRSHLALSGIDTSSLAEVEAMVEHLIAEREGGSWQRDSKMQIPRPIARERAVKYKINEFINGLRAMKKMVRHGVVTEKVATERASVCADCPFHNRHIECRECQKSELVQKVKDKIPKVRSNTVLRYLGMCDICRCTLPVKVWMRDEDLPVAVPYDQWKELPDFCWVKESPALRRKHEKKRIGK